MVGLRKTDFEQNLSTRSQKSLFKDELTEYIIFSNAINEKKFENTLKKFRVKNR